MKTKGFILILVVSILFVSVANAITTEQNEKLHAMAALLNIMQADIDFGEELEDPSFVFMEDPAQMIMHYSYKGYSTELLRLIFKSSTDEAKAPLLDLCQSSYQMIREATEDIVSDLPITVTIGGNDGGIAVYTINGVDMSDYIIEE